MLGLPLFTKEHSFPSKFLAINFSAEAVRVLALYCENGKTRIIGSGKCSLEQGTIRDGAIIAKDVVIDALHSAITEAHADLGEKIDNAIYGISGDLCLGLMTIIRAKRTHKSPVTKKEVADIYSKIDEIAIMQAQNEYMQITGRSDIDLEMVTTSNIYTKLDGQRVHEVENKTGALLETAVFNAFVPSFHIKAVQEVSKKNGLKIMALGSEMYCVTQALLAITENLNDFILINIDGDFTNVAVIFSKGITATRTLNVGYSHFVEGVSERMGLTKHEAEKVLKSYIQGKLTSSEGVIVQNALKIVTETWLVGLELLFGEFTGVKTFPSKIFMAGEGTDIPDLWNTVTSENENWSKSVPFKTPPDIKKMSFMDVNCTTDSTGKITSTEWLTTACLALIYLEMKGPATTEQHKQ
jgi:Tfp pilus assembly PilM family ATPase